MLKMLEKLKQLFKKKEKTKQKVSEAIFTPFKSEVSFDFSNLNTKKMERCYFNAIELLNEGRLMDAESYLQTLITCTDKNFENEKLLSNVKILLAKTIKKIYFDSSNLSKVIKLVSSEMRYKKILIIYDKLMQLPTLCKIEKCNIYEESLFIFIKFVYKIYPYFDNDMLLFALEKLENKNSISTLCVKIPTEDGGYIERPSNLEMFYVYFTKVLFTAGQFSRCAEQCQNAINDMKSFHYNNEFFLKSRLIQSLVKLNGITDEYVTDMEVLIYSFDIWQAFYHTGILYNLNNEKEKALKFYLQALLKKGKTDAKVKLIEAVGDYFEDKKCQDIAEYHYALVRDIKERNGWIMSNAFLEKTENAKILTPDGYQKMWELLKSSLE